MYQIRSTNWSWDRQPISSFVEGVHQIKHLYERDNYGTYDLVRDGKIVYAFSYHNVGLYYPTYEISDADIERYRRRHYR